MRKLMLICCAMLIVALVMPVTTPAGERDEKHARELGLQSEEALKKILAVSDEAEQAFQMSVGWAFFEMKRRGEAGADMSDQAKGKGVAMVAGSRDGTPMSCEQLVATAQEYQFVFFFRTDEAWVKFVEGNWDSGKTAKQAASRSGLKLDDPFVQGVKAFKIVGAGPTETANIETTKCKRGFD